MEELEQVIELLIIIKLLTWCSLTMRETLQNLSERFQFGLTLANS